MPPWGLSLVVTLLSALANFLEWGGAKTMHVLAMPNGFMDFIDWIQFRQVIQFVMSTSPMLA
jgi:hypothetical protein